MLGNLSGNARRRSDSKAVLRYADVILAADPTNLTQRGFRISLAVAAGDVRVGAAWYREALELAQSVGNVRATATQLGNLGLLRCEASFDQDGGAGTGGDHITYPSDTPLANLHLSLLDKIGVPVETLGHSTGRLPLSGV